MLLECEQLLPAVGLAVDGLDGGVDGEHRLGASVLEARNDGGRRLTQPDGCPPDCLPLVGPCIVPYRPNLFPNSSASRAAGAVTSAVISDSHWRPRCSQAVSQTSAES